MPKAVIYPKLWIKNHDDQEWSVFPNVTGYQEGATWYAYEGVFRNKPGAGAGQWPGGRSVESYSTQGLAALDDRPRS